MAALWKSSSTSNMILRRMRVKQFVRTFSVSTANNISGSTSPKSESFYWTDSVGFVGLGNMGAHMARNLIKKGHSITVYDKVAASTEEVVQAGGVAANSAAEVAEKSQTIITMLPASPHVLDAYTSPNGIFSKLQTGSLLIDSSTIDPSVAQDMNKQAESLGATYVDAPVSGGILAARDALLTFMVGGSESGYQRAETLLKEMGKNIIHCGPSGTGQAAKICNNMLLAISMIGTSEAMNLGTKLGLDAKLLAKILNMSTGRCWSSELYNPYPGIVEGIPSSNNYQGGFGTALMAKDLGLAQNAATQKQAPTPMGSLAHQIYRLMSNSELATKDFASVYLFLQQINK